MESFDSSRNLEQLLALVQIQNIRQQVMEERRRTRINQSVEALKTILRERDPQFTVRTSPHGTELDKADILEMTVDFLSRILTNHRYVASWQSHHNEARIHYTPYGRRVPTSNIIYQPIARTNPNPAQVPYRNSYRSNYTDSSCMNMLPCTHAHINPAFPRIYGSNIYAATSQDSSVVDNASGIFHMSSVNTPYHEEINTRESQSDLQIFSEDYRVYRSNNSGETSPDICVVSIASRTSPKPGPSTPGHEDSTSDSQADNQMYTTYPRFYTSNISAETSPDITVVSRTSSRPEPSTPSYEDSTSDSQVDNQMYTTYHRVYTSNISAETSPDITVVSRTSSRPEPSTPSHEDSTSDSQADNQMYTTYPRVYTSNSSAETSQYISVASEIFPRPGPSSGDHEDVNAWVSHNPEFFIEPRIFFPNMSGLTSPNISFLPNASRDHEDDRILEPQNKNVSDCVFWRTQ
ncbi:hypothetical protein GWI33_013431 [Rhynchophorus ferrugineus]|uniref:BHLH domain-containing protein n=1 Tax=Rhynchophorus ferrugineus TaxID=354439 RepID=A0A834IH06_RHYFE|nr:hypothetical protein GWI33_013431 [Rhynchophorus ferrugineus]